MGICIQILEMVNNITLNIWSYVSLILSVSFPWLAGVVALIPTLYSFVENASGIFVLFVFDVLN